MATAADCPGKYDVVINGKGYVLLDALQPNVPFRVHRAVYTYSPTFLERTNVTGAWGDNQQAFWLTFSQNDWSGGEGLRFARPNDPNKSNRYWLGSALDPSVPGQVTPARATRPLTFGSAVHGAVAGASSFYTVSSTNLFEVADTDGTITDRGAHGAGAITVSAGKLAYDGSYVYIAGGTKIRRFDQSALTFADFSATVVNSVAFLNNTLYGAVNGVLYSFDTSGTATTLYTFKTATGTASGSWNIVKIVPYGGQLAILTGRTSTGNGNSEVYLWNGTGVTRIAGFPNNFNALDLAVSNEILVVIGYEQGFGNLNRMGIYYYANGSVGTLFRDTNYVSQTASGGISLTPWGSGFFFADAGRGLIRFYNLATGSFHSVTSYTPVSNNVGTMATTSSGQSIHIQHGGTGQVLLNHNIAATTVSGVVTSPLIDFDSSLTKYVKGVTVDFTGTGTVDLAYQLNDLDGSWTTIQTGVTSGTEYSIGQTCRSIGIQVTLNNGGVTLEQPVLKRIYVRAVPELQTFRKREYILDLTGAAPTAPRKLRDGTDDFTIPFDAVTNLVAAAQSTTPISITDRLGTFTGIIEPDGFEIYEMHPEAQNLSKSGSYVVRVSVREV